MKSKTKIAQHTPGPWGVGPVEGGDGIWHEDDFIGTINGTANARLIAAAPDLLAVVREYTENIISDPEMGAFRACCGAEWSDTRESMGNGNKHKSDCAASAAIAKAEGR